MSKNSHKRQLIIVLCVFWTLLALSFAYISYSVADSENSKVSPINIFSMNMVKFYLWLAFFPLIFLGVKHFGFEKRETFPFNFLIQAGFCLLFVIIHTAIYTPIVWTFEPPNNQNVYPSITTLFAQYLFYGNFYLGVLLYSLLVVVIQAYLLLTKYQTEEARNSLLKSELAKAQLQALKAQLQPHFLFNTLHSISSLNISNPAKANVMIARLGELLRMTLERSDEQMVTLGEELEFLRCYLEIEQIRFRDRLTTEFDIADETLSQEVPHLILQPIVENAVKHGIAPYSAKGKILVGARQRDGKLFLRIRDESERAMKIAARSGSGKGLSNIRLRLEHFYGQNFRFALQETGNGMQVDLEVPTEVEKIS